MAEPLKAIYNATFIREFGEKVRRGWRDFDSDRFAGLTFADGWDELELKGRMRRISLSLGATLPQDYPRALAILEAISPECRGFPYLIFPDFVQVYGLGDWERSIAALERFTPLSSAEFAIRPFILKEPERTMEQMLRWAEHPDEHVRRLASEGRLPSAPALGGRVARVQEGPGAHPADSRAAEGRSLRVCSAQRSEQLKRHLEGPSGSRAGYRAALERKEPGDGRDAQARLPYSNKGECRSGGAVLVRIERPKRDRRRALGTVG